MQQLTNAKGFDACPAASTDGSQVAFCSDQTGNLEIWMMDADGSNPRQVTHTGGRVFFPDISPDGTKLVFQGTIGTDPTSQIYVSAIDGSGIVPLTAETSATGDANYPVWSPDGSKIAYIGVQDGLEQVFVMNADGSGKTQLTTDAVNHDQVPDWSPDGSKIAYAGGEGTRARVRHERGWDEPHAADRRHER